jgi:hypothetical protein
MTRYLLAEQVLFRIAAGYPDVSENVQLIDIITAIPQVVNAMLKAQQFSINMPQGETIPDNAMIGTYENITVNSINIGTQKSKAILPAIPISLPKNMGVYQIYNANYPDSPYIPLQRGMLSLLKTDSLLTDILGQVAYEVQGKNILFNKDLPVYGITSVTMELVLLDISLYNDTDMLPLTADMEALVVEQLVSMFERVGNETGIVNPYTNIENQPSKSLIK